MANTDPQVMKQKRIGGIDIYHAMGHKGQGYNVMHLESATSEHGLGCTDDILDIAPLCKVYRTGSVIETSNGVVTKAECYYEGRIYTIEEFIKEKKIKFITKSTGGKVTDTARETYWQNLIDKYNVVLVCPAGNQASNGVTCAFPDKVSFIIGAVGISDSGVIKSKTYTGQGAAVDFSYFTGDQEGTSFATPRILAVMILLCNRFGDKTWKELYEMLKILAKDVEVSGFDIKTGWGVPILHEDDNRRLGKLAEQTITGTLREIDIKKLPSGEIKRVKAILYKGENYTRLRDNEDILGVVDVEYDAVNKIPTVAD